MTPIGSRNVAAVLGVILAIMVSCCSASGIYMYLHQGSRFCTAPDRLLISGHEGDRYMVHYGFRGDTDLEGTVSLRVRTGSWSGPRVECILDPTHSSITLDLVWDGNYRFCFEYDGGRTRIPFEFEIERANANNGQGIDPYMGMVQSIADTDPKSFIVGDEVELLTTPRVAFESTVRGIYLRVVVCTLVSTANVLATVTWQVWTLRKFV